MNRVRLIIAASLSLFVGCRDTQLPSVPGPAQAGTIGGTVLYAVPGKSELAAGAGARVSVLGSGASTTADAEGRFLIEGISRDNGILLLELEINAVSRRRVLRLEDIGAGTGRDISLGQVVLARNASVRGRIVLDDVVGASGLGGVTAFVPGGPWSAMTGDDGSYTIEALPEGALQVAFFKAGYSVGSLDVELGAGEERQLQVVRLGRVVDGPASVKATLLKSDGAPASDARARLRHGSGEQSLAVSASGEISKTELASGLYSFAIEREGSLSIALYNVLLLPGENTLGVLRLIDGPSSAIDLSDVVPMQPRDAGVSFDAGLPHDAGTSLPDGGVATAPVAIASGPELAAAGSQVTVTGMSSTGRFPLVYHWRQSAGTAVTLSANDSALAHSPRFAAPAAGTVIELQLVVEDPDGLTSAPAAVRVGIGARPVARFTPDSGALISGGQSVPLSSTSFDDAGVVLASYEWSLLSGTGGTLLHDGGSSAVWQAPTVAFGAPDLIGGVSLQVTNGIGVKSSVTTNLYSVRGANPNNWSLDAGPTQLVVVGAVPGQVQLSGSVSSPLFSMPQYSVAWSCPPAVSLLSGDTLTPRFVAPVIVGSTQTLTCDVTVNAQAPLAPAQLTGSTSVLLRDGAAPTVVGSNVESTRMSRFGIALTANEPLGASTITMSCNPAYGWGYRFIYGSLIAGSVYGVLPAGGTCSGFATDLKDLATPANTGNDLPFGNGSVQIDDLWHGPYVSSSTFDDPRPVVASLSQMPRQVQAHEGVTPGTPPGYELLATQGSDLVQLAGLDLSSRPTCEPSCPLIGTALSLGLPGGSVPTGRRATFAAAELFVSVSTDGGVAPTVVRRNAAGTWSTFSGLTGIPDNWDLNLRTTRFDGTSQLLVDTWNPATQTFSTTDLAATGLTEVSLLASANNLLAAATGPTKQLLIRKRNPSDLSWSTFAPTTTHTNVTSMKWEPQSSGVTLLALEAGASNALVIQRVDTNGLQTVSSAGVVGYDITSWGGNSYIVYSLNGDIRLRTISGSVWSGAGGGPLDFGGPPRTGYSAPYPVLLDNNPICEAVYPSMAFVEDALIITWQERCSPEVKWRVVARTIR